MSRRISALTGEVVSTGETFSTPSLVFTSDDVTAYELASKYHKSITAKVDGKYIGWGSPMAFCNYKFHKENEKKFSEVTYWHERITGEYCKWHMMLLYSLHQPTPFTVTAEDARYFYYYRGIEIVRSNPMEVKFKSLYDKQGELIKFI